MTADFEQDPGGEPDVDIDVELRTDALEELAYAAHQYLDPAGEHDEGVVIEKLVGLAVDSQVHSRKDREKTAVSRSGIMKHVFPLVPGPGQFAEQDDPEASQALYKRLNTRLWRWLDSNAGGIVQSRLNGQHDLILCRTTATAEGTWGIYTTRNWQCLVADFTTPDKTAIKNAVVKMGRNVDMAAERAPEHARRLKNELTSGVRIALTAGVAPITARLEAAAEDEADEPVEPDEPGDDELTDDR